jgi:hypothetical protein
MALKLISERTKQTGYLAGYCVLLFYTLSGLMFQGASWLFAGAFCWFGIVSRFFFSYIYRYNKKRLLEISLETERLKNEKDESEKKGHKFSLNFGFFS